MSVDGVLAQGRAASRRLMRESCTVERKSGAPVLDGETGQLTQAWTEIYSGPCRIKPRSHRETEHGEREVTLHRYVVVFPQDTSPAFRREDRVVVTSSDDGWVVGRPLEVIDVGFSGTSTARRITVEDKEG